MKRKYTSFIAACFFMCLFVCMGISSFCLHVFPGKTAIENVTGTDNGEQDANEKQKDCKGEFDPGEYCIPGVLSVNMPSILRPVPGYQMVRPYCNYHSIVTPPPEI